MEARVDLFHLALMHHLSGNLVLAFIEELSWPLKLLNHTSGHELAELHPFLSLVLLVAASIVRIIELLLDVTLRVRILHRIYPILLILGKGSSAGCGYRTSIGDRD